MIKDTIKEKLGLVSTDKQIGQSFLHNGEVCNWPFLEGYEAVATDCDEQGVLFDDNRIRFLIGKGTYRYTIQMTEEFIMDMKFEVVVEHVKKLIEDSEKKFAERIKPAHPGA